MAACESHRWKCRGAEDRLPTDFFERLRQATGCYAVMFVSLTTFQAYPPLQVGWKARLVDCQQELPLVVVDEVFDAGIRCGSRRRDRLCQK